MGFYCRGCANLFDENKRLTAQIDEARAALKAVLDAYRSYGAIARRDTEEYKSLTLARKAIRKLEKERA